ncbi:hypothetical protein LOK49_LG10G00954 [Camellia lanceoleosa]|uniref:Uncharacterized protein n=1 Tax=Camellia lanceoleosa TaxID=1840588 RepID=A0ACC0GAK7_9ERIC|nr:hypothetical protein LOK49_LG10G00954 [Camellia lanceoleosa]
MIYKNLEDAYGDAIEVELYLAEDQLNNCLDVTNYAVPNIESSPMVTLEEQSIGFVSLPAILDPLDFGMDNPPNPFTLLLCPIPCLKPHAYFIDSFFTLNIGSIFHMENMVLLDRGTLQPIVLFDGISPRIVDACPLPSYVIASCQSSAGFLMMDAIKGRNVVFRHKLHFLDDFS